MLELLLGTEEPDKVVDRLIATNYLEEFCIYIKPNIRYISQLIHSGFLIMSALTRNKNEGVENILVPKLHNNRMVLDFKSLHIPRRIESKLALYSLYFDTDFNRIIERCISSHGDAWLTPFLIGYLVKLREKKIDNRVKIVSFALYRDKRLVAGEFGTLVGSIYTSYSGYHDEDSAGTIQMILTAHFLEGRGIKFWDLGMPAEYKKHLGAVELSRVEFIRLFRGVRNMCCGLFRNDSIDISDKGSNISGV